MIHSFHRPRGISAKWLAAATAFFWLAFLARPGMAHRVSIFGWVEGERVYTQSKFSGGKKPRDAIVAVYDGQGNLLHEGKTDENGEFSFPVPQRGPVKVVLKASMGHLAEWTFSEKDFARKPAESQSAGSGPWEAARPEPLGPDAPVSSLDREEIERAVDKILERRLVPVMDILADLSDPKPGIGEIMGGIGYIVGLAGVALYVSVRRKEREGKRVRG